jgi:hypothetical protein
MDIVLQTVAKYGVQNEVIEVQKEPFSKPIKLFDIDMKFHIG